MKKIFISIFCFLIIFLLLFQCFPNISRAFDPYDTSPFSAKEDSANEAGDIAANLTGMILSMIQVGGVGLAIITLIVLAVKYMTGSIEDKVEVKKNSVTYVIAAGIFFGGTIIVTIIKNFVFGNLE